MATQKKTAMKKIAVKTVITTCRKDIKEANDCKALLATLFSKAEKQWIPEVNNTLKNATALLKKALDISVNDENGSMDVAVSSDEGEAVSVTDNTNTEGGEDQGGFPPEQSEDQGNEEGHAEAPMSNEDMTKTFKLMQNMMNKMQKSITSKTNKK